MQFPFEPLRKLFVAIEKLPITAQHVIAAVVFVGFFRFLIEFLISAHIFIEGRWSIDPAIVIHSIAFYLGTFCMLLAAFSLLLKDKQRVFPIIFCGIFAGFIPPTIDLILRTGNYHYNYFLEFTPTLFSTAQPLGESLSVWILIFGSGLYAWYRKNEVRYFFFGAFVTYVLAQFGGWFVVFLSGHILNILYPAFNLPPISLGLDQTFPTESNFQISQIILTLLWTGIACASYMIYRFEICIPILKRPFSALWGLLLLVGATLGDGIDAYDVLKAIAISFAFVLVQAENDFFDKKLDALTSRASSITKEDMVFIRFFMVLLPLAFVFFDPAFGILLGATLFLGFLYNAEGFRLKTHFLTGMLVISLSTFIVLLAGYFGFPTLSYGYVVLLMMIAALYVGVILNIRDYKDFEGDKKGEIQTLYVVLNAKKMEASTVHHSLLFLIFLGTTFMLGLHFFSASIASLDAVLVAGLIISAYFAYVSSDPRKSTLFAVGHLMLLEVFLILFPITILG